MFRSSLVEFGGKKMMKTTAKKEIIKLEKETAIKVLKARLIMTLANLIGNFLVTTTHLIDC